MASSSASRTPTPPRQPRERRPAGRRCPAPPPARPHQPGGSPGRLKYAAIPVASATGSHSSQRERSRSSERHDAGREAADVSKVAACLKRSPMRPALAAPHVQSMLDDRPHLALAEGHNINHECSRQVRSFADRLSAHRWCADRAVQLAVRPSSRRPLSAAHRGHRPAALDAGRDRGDLRRTGLARADVRRSRRCSSSSAPRGTPRSRIPLLAEGKAYHCWATPEELEAMRARQRALGLPMRYDGRWRDRDPSEAPRGRAAGDPPEGAADRRDPDRGHGPGRDRGRQRAARRHGAAAWRRHARPTCCRWWSTTSTWRSPTSSVATTT